MFTKLSYLVSGLFLLLGFTAQAQIPAGTISITPDFSFSSTKNTIENQFVEIETKSSTFDLGLNGTYFIIDNLEVGLGIGLSSSKDEFDDLENTSSAFNIGPVVGYNIGIANNLYAAVGVSLSFTSGTDKSEGLDDTKFSGLLYGGQVGLRYIVDNKIGVHIGVGPTFGTIKDKDLEDVELKVSNIGANFGASLFF